MDAVARDRAEIDAGEIDIGQPASVEQNQRVYARRRAEAAQARDDDATALRGE